MGGPTQPTRAAKRFRVVVLLGAAALCISAYQPWSRIWGLTYTFVNVDDWRFLPMAELVVAAGSVVIAVVHLGWIRRTGLVLGASALVLNVVGVVAGARLANVHDSDPYFRIWAATSVVPERGLWIALLTCAVLIAGALSGWSATTTVRDTPGDRGRSLQHVSTAGDQLRGIPRQRRADDDDI